MQTTQSLSRIARDNQRKTWGGWSDSGQFLLSDSALENRNTMKICWVLRESPLPPGFKIKSSQKNFTLSKTSTSRVTHVSVVFVASADVWAVDFTSHIKCLCLLTHSADVAPYTANDAQAFLKVAQVHLQAITRYLSCSRGREAAKEWNICEN